MGRINVRLWLSPAATGIISMVLSLFFLLPGARYYRRELGESLHVDALTGIWVILCSLAFLAGVVLMGYVGGVRGQRARAAPEPRRVPEKRLALLALVTILLNGYALLALVRAFGPVGFLNALQGVSEVDLRLTVYNILKSANIGWSLAFTAPVVAVLVTAIARLRAQQVRAQGLLALTVLIIGMNLLVQVATQSKGGAVALVVVAGISLLLDRRTPIRVTFRGMALTVLLGVALLTLAATLQARRGADLTSAAGIVQELAGYTAVGYNRLAALMDGSLVVPNMDTGYWTNRWWWGLPGTGGVNRGITALGFSIPDPAFDSWLDTFRSVRQAGLNDRYIWVTIFGEAYADYRWGGLLWFMFYGMMCQWLFKKVQNGSLATHALYAWVATSNLQWYSGATATTRGLLFGLLIMAYLELPIKSSFVFRRRRARPRLKLIWSRRV